MAASDGDAKGQQTQDAIDPNLNIISDVCKF